MAPPFQIAEFDIMFGEGISKAGEIIDLGVEYGIVKNPDRGLVTATRNSDKDEIP